MGLWTELGGSLINFLSCSKCLPPQGAKKKNEGGAGGPLGFKSPGSQVSWSGRGCSNGLLPSAASWSAPPGAEADHRSLMLRRQSPFVPPWLLLLAVCHFFRNICTSPYKGVGQPAGRGWVAAAVLRAETCLKLTAVHCPRLSPGSCKPSTDSRVSNHSFRPIPPVQLLSGGGNSFQMLPTPQSSQNPPWIMWFLFLHIYYALVT